VTGPELLKVFIACVGFGFGGEAIRRYRAFKHRRRETPEHIRNAGFWTDARIYHTEAIGAAMGAAIPFSAIIPLMVSDRTKWWLYSYPALLGYALLTYLIIRGMNVGRVQ
jgi:hypothetical protein